MLQFAGTLKRIYSGGDTARARRWVASDYIDRVLFAAPGAPVLFWPGAGAARLVPGLTDSDGYDGVEVFDDHVLLWRGAILKWSARSDFGLWIPLNLTVAAGRAAIESDFTQLASGSSTPPVFLADVAGEFVVGQFVRTISYESDATAILYDYFRVRSAALEAEFAAQSIKRAQVVPAGKTVRVSLGYYSTFLDWPVQSRIRLNGEATRLVVTGRSRNATYSAALASDSAAIPPVGQTMSLPMGRIVTEAQSGDVVSVGPSTALGQDLYEIVGPPSFSLAVRRLGIGDKLSGTIWVEGSEVTFQNWVEVRNDDTVDVPIPAEAAVSVVSSLILEPIGLTGGTAVGTKIPAGAVLETVDANESGEVLNVGSAINGDIYAVVALAEFAYILKRRSIQSIQSVGQAAGTFFLRPEILDEGVVGRYAWCRAGDREIAFVGNKGIYVYAGGQNLRAVCVEHWDTFRDEVDWARADEIVAHHNRRQSEVWFVYPTPTAETKVLIWNYFENSVVVDRYSGDLNGITAIGAVDWELAPTWDSLDVAEKCDGEAKRWYEYVEVPEREYAVFATGGTAGNLTWGEDPEKTYPRMYVHGRVWSRATNDDCEPEAIVSLAETPDFDFGTPEAWKYADTVYLVLTQRSGVPEGAMLEVQVGARDNLNSPIRWSSVQSLSVTEASSAPTKINATVSGRYLRLRFRSATVGANWGISAYHLTARRGGTY